MTIAAPVRPVPVETVTPIRPSEAIRLGCLIAPVQITGNLFGAEGQACALGAMALGWGLHEDDPNYGHIARRLPKILPYPGSAPAGLAQDATDVIYLLNDYDDWSRERIADWLAEQGL